MHLERPTTVRPTDSFFVLNTTVPHSPSQISDDLRDPLVLDMSLAASPDIVELQRKHEAIERELQSTWAMADQGGVWQDARSFEHVKLPQTNAAVQGLLHLRDLLYASFEAEPLEDGMDHPAEDIIDGAIRSTDDDHVFDWLYRACLDAEHPTFSASVLRCLGRQMRPGTVLWRTELVRKALTADDVEIRDAAVQVAEFWGGLDIRDQLKIRVQTEPLQWLRNYMQDVIEDLG